VIDQLPMLTPDPARAARVIAKCHRTMTPRPKRRISEPALLAGFCALYLVSVVLTALEVFAA
jgi:hypothetical protein